MIFDFIIFVNYDDIIFYFDSDSVVIGGFFIVIFVESSYL